MANNFRGYFFAAHCICVHIALLQMAQMLLNCIGETVTRLLNLSIKQCDGSWLTQLLLMLRSHVAVLRTLCTIVCHLVTKQASTLSDCHVHALAAVMVHWNNYHDCSAGIKVQCATVDCPETEVAKTKPFVSHVLKSLPLSTTANMSFTLLFAVSYIIYARMISHDLTVNENRALSDQGLVMLQSAEDSVIVPDHIVQLVSYLGPRLVKDLRHSSNCGSGETVVSCKFSSVERFLSDGLVRSSLEQGHMSFETWVRKEIEVVDDDGLSADWLSEYYNWVVFTRWHKLQSIADSAPGTYFVSVLQVMVHAMLDFDVQYSHPYTCRCCDSTAQQQNHRSLNGRHNVFNFLQASRH